MKTIILEQVSNGWLATATESGMQKKMVFDGIEAVCKSLPELASQDIKATQFQSCENAVGHSGLRWIGHPA